MQAHTLCLIYAMMDCGKTLTCSVSGIQQGVGLQQDWNLKHLAHRPFGLFAARSRRAGVVGSKASPMESGSAMAVTQLPS